MAGTGFQQKTFCHVGWSCVCQKQLVENVFTTSYVLCGEKPAVCRWPWRPSLKRKIAMINFLIGKSWKPKLVITLVVSLFLFIFGAPWIFEIASGAHAGCAPDSPGAPGVCLGPPQDPGGKDFLKSKISAGTGKRF